MPQEVIPDRRATSPTRELVITRTFDAPRELVFEAFTDPRHLTKWWGPNRCTVIACEADPVVGGCWRISMRSPRVLPQFVNRHAVNRESRSGPRQHEPGVYAQKDDWIVEKQLGIYQEVIKPERLVFTYAFEGADGRPGPQTVITVAFADESGRTRLTLHQAIFESVSVRDDHIRGWTEALDRLVEYLPQPD